jgi:hypothetical protein
MNLNVGQASRPALSRGRPGGLPHVGILLLVLAVPAPARVTRLVIEHRETERLTGRFFGSLDPAHPLNGIINDLSLAPRNSAGLVEYSATFTLLLPAKPDGVLWYEVPNRGNMALSPAGGHILVASGWQGDLTPRPGLETITVPIAPNVTGPVLARLSNIRGTTASLETGFAALRYQRPVTLDTTKALLTRQLSDDGAQTPISPADWAFANCEKMPFPGEPDPARICLKSGFEPDQLYQLVYTAKDPMVLGIGLAATRDLISFLRYSNTADNPVRGLVKYAIAAGTSQSGNFLKTFVHLGFNQDEGRRIVWDGINPNIAARQTPINFRFAIPGGAAGLYEPGSEGELAWTGLLARCRATKTCPKVIETFGSSEFWGWRMSPGLVGRTATADIPLPPEVRRYYFPGVTHGGGRGGFSLATTPGRGCVLPDNPNPSSDTMHALRQALADWVVNGVAPPLSRYPTLARGELVAPDHAVMGFPVIPGSPLPDHLINALPDYDFGSTFRAADLSGAIAIQPPRIRGYLPMLVPKTDSDGNEIGGVPSVLHQAPLGTYLGWNATASGYYKGRGCGFAGGWIPFARTRAERAASGDPRPSLEERYGTHEAFVAKVRAAAERMVQSRFLLRTDADRLVKEAEASEVLR